MNCKPGDLAIVISSRNKGHLFLIGKMVEVISQSYLGQLIIDGTGRQQENRTGEPAWLVKHRTGDYLFRDSALRPIRPGDLNEDIDTDIKKPDEVAA